MNVDHDYDATVGNRTAGKGCPFCSGRRINHTNSLTALEPALASEWHETLNGELTPDLVGVGSKKRVWWRCHKGPDHVWSAMIVNRTSPSVRSGCAVCVGRVVVPSTSLAVLNPTVASEWHPTRNRDKTPESVTISTTKKAWWKCHSDPSHEWEASIQTRASRGYGCPFCSGKRATQENNLAKVHPDLAAQWHPKLNGNLTPSDVLPMSNKEVWWKCPKEVDHEWKSPIYNRVQAPGCPCCSGQRCVPSNSLATVNPELATQWHPTKNGKLTPADVTSRSGRKVWWVCPNNSSHEWRSEIFNRAKGVGCRRCAKTGFNPAMEGWLYLLEHDDWGYTQIGITNVPNDRLRDHRRNGWNLREVQGPFSGDFVETTEKLALRALKARGARLGSRASSHKFDGHTESWPTSSLTLRSLAELMEWIRTDES